MFAPSFLRVFSLACIVLAAWLGLRSPGLCANASTMHDPVGQTRVLVLIPGLDALERGRMLGVALRGDPGESGLLLAIEDVSLPSAARDQLDRARELAHARAAAGVIWVDLTDPEEARVYLLESSSGRSFVRSIPRGGSFAADVETIAVIVRTAAVAVASGGSLEMSPMRQDVFEPSPEEILSLHPHGITRHAHVGSSTASRHAAAPPKVPAWRILTAYSGTSFAPEVPWQSGIDVEIHGYPTKWLHLGLGYTAMLPSRVDTQLVSVTVQRQTIAFHVGHESRLGTHVFVGPDVRIGAEPLRRRITGITGVPIETNESVRWLWTVVARLSLRVTLIGGLHLDLAAGLEVPINAYDHVLGPADRQVVIHQSPVRAHVGAGVGYRGLRVAKPRRWASGPAQAP